MANAYPLTITVSAKGEPFKLRFARDAASVLNKSDRLRFEVTNTGLVLKGLWEPDLDEALDELRKKLGKELHLTNFGVVFLEGNPSLEPIVKVTIVAPEADMGDIIGDLVRRRGRITTMENHDRGMEIGAKVPLAELVGYRPDLERVSPTQWIITVDFDSYQPIFDSDGPGPDHPASQALRG